MENNSNETSTANSCDAIEPAKVCAPHWSTNFWALCGIVAVISLLSIFSGLIGAALGIAFYCYARRCQRQHGVETIGTWKPGWGLLAGFFTLLTVSFLPTFTGMYMAFMDFYDVGIPTMSLAKSFFYMFRDPECIHVLQDTINILLLKFLYTLFSTSLMVFPSLLSICLLLPVLTQRYKLGKSTVILCSLLVTLAIFASLIKNILFFGVGTADLLNWVGGVLLESVQYGIIALVASASALAMLNTTKFRLIDSAVMIIPLYAAMNTLLYNARAFLLNGSAVDTLDIAANTLLLVVYTGIIIAVLLVRRRKLNRKNP